MKSFLVGRHLARGMVHTTDLLPFRVIARVTGCVEHGQHGIEGVYQPLLCR